MNFNETIKNMYVVYDDLAKECATGIFLAKNHQMALRSYKQILTDNPAFPEPKDFRLLYLGVFNCSSATLAPETSITLCQGLDDVKDLEE